MRTVLTWLTIFVVTPLLGSVALLAVQLRLSTGPGSIPDVLGRVWVRGVLWASGVTVVLHGERHLLARGQIFVVNHVSRFDILALASRLHSVIFVAAAKVRRVPVFGRWAHALGTIYLERDDPRSAMTSYRQAAARIGDGASLVVFPEGERGSDYALRPFKRGPFALAIRCGVPIVPVVIHGTLHVHPKGTIRVRPGRVDVHFLEPVPVSKLTHVDRDRLAAQVHARMAAFLRDTYNIASQSSPAAELSSDQPALSER